jgi:hypothetical protein
MIAELFGPSGNLGQAWQFGAPVGTILGFLVMEAGQRFARHWEDRDAQAEIAAHREP